MLLQEPRADPRRYPTRPLVASAGPLLVPARSESARDIGGSLFQGPTEPSSFEWCSGNWLARCGSARSKQTEPHRPANTRQPCAHELRDVLRQIMASRWAVPFSRTNATGCLQSLIVVAPEYLRAPLQDFSSLVQLRRVEDFAAHRRLVSSIRPRCSRCSRSPHEFVSWWP